MAGTTLKALLGPSNLKLSRIRCAPGAGAVDLMRNIKAAIDPHGIMSPGKIY
jgi:FAD/FMN-containing dehydrogenase